MEGDNGIIIIGAGACGLYTAELLSHKGRIVTLLEARHEAGGRIRTVTGAFGQPLEQGAEFIHGKAPLTKKLLRRAGTHTIESEGNFYRSHSGKIAKANDIVPGMDLLMKALGELEHDETLDAFLEARFSGERYNDLRATVRGMAQGFDAGDPSRISAKSLYEEWSGDSMERSSLIRGGYVELVRHLTSRCIKNGCAMHFNTAVRHVGWSRGKVHVTSNDGRTFTGSQLVVTIPLNLLSTTDESNSVAFTPALPNHVKVMGEMGYGTVIKVVMEFRHRFWSDARFDNEFQQVGDLAFLMNDSAFPVLWTNPSFPVITAWAGGSHASGLAVNTDEALGLMAVEAVASAFGIARALVDSMLESTKTFNWERDPFACGAYSYPTPLTPQAKRLLKKPVDSTIFFAGEALGKSNGTVEAALESAREVSRKIR